MKKSSLTRMFCIALVLVENAVGKLRKEKDSKKMLLKFSDTDTVNLCTIEGNSVPFHCFCSDGTATATKAKCWVFNGLNQEHNLWSLFATQPRITELNVMVTQMGQLSFIPTKALQYLKELRTLTIIYGGVSTVHPYAFANLTKVHEILLARNRIVTLSHHAFAHLTSLATLDLDENRIAEISRDVFVDLPNLKKLFIRYNNLSVIQDGAFRQLGHLSELELGINSISILTKDIFAGLGELRKLSLNSNKIVMLGDLTFAELWILEDLDLEENQIEFISERAFAGLTHLRKLNLRYNKLKNLRSSLLDSVPDVTNFDIRHNYLETLTFDNVKPILHNFYNDSSYFYLDDNHFVCDCRLAWMHILKNETKNQLIRDNLEQLTCHLEVDDAEVPASFLFSTEVTDKPLFEDRDPAFKAEDANEYGGDAYYDDNDYPQQTSTQIQKTSQVKDPSLLHFFQIPLADLPCVDESKPTTQIPRYPYTPIYAEINANRCSLVGVSFTVPLCITTVLVYLS